MTRLRFVRVCTATMLWAGAAAPLMSQAPATTVYVVRHAEKQNTSADTPLSSAGRARAKALAHVLKDAGITAIYVSEFRRSQETAQPLAAALGVTPVRYTAAAPEGAVAAVLGSPAGAKVLIVAHSNTVDDIVSGLGGAGVPELTEEQFDRLFVVERVEGRGFVQKLRYGTPTP